MLPASSPAPADVLAAVNAATARGGPVRLELRWFASVTSTMDVAEEAAQAGAPEGLVVAAEEQTHGRGRRGRAWSSPPGAGLYVTFLFRPPLVEGASSVLSLLTLATGVAVRDAIARASGFSPELKWPNDLMVARRKLAGILSEGIAVGTPEQTVLVGMGINVLAAAHPADVAMRATSLESELGRTVDRGLLLEELLVTVPRAYDDLRLGNTDDILRAWRGASPSAVGRIVEWHDASGVHRGVTAGIDATGALLVKTSGGTERVLAGELSWM
jgi:BirA family biotin operon repressor/biotin-[acetyl-CoA-carboxylase] ligase